MGAKAATTTTTLGIGDSPTSASQELPPARCPNRPASSSRSPGDWCCSSSGGEPVAPDLCSERDVLYPNVVWNPVGCLHKCAVCLFKTTRSRAAQRRPRALLCSSTRQMASYETRPRHHETGPAGHFVHLRSPMQTLPALALIKILPEVVDVFGIMYSAAGRTTCGASRDRSSPTSPICVAYS